jgi:hypothetical protein
VTCLDGGESLAVMDFDSRTINRGESLYLLPYVSSTGVCLTERHIKYLHGSESKLTVSKPSFGHINRFWLFLDVDPIVQAIHD